MPDHKRLHTSVLVIGAGIAGCTTALTLADLGFQVSLIAAGENEEDGNSWLAQGGIIYKASDNSKAGAPFSDSKALMQDIFKAGHKLNNKAAVKFLAEEGPKTVENILFERLQIPFAKNSQNEWDLVREGGHSASRIVHCADYTGHSIMEGFIAAINKSPNINLLRNHSAVDLLTTHHHTNTMTYRYQLTNSCCGAYVLNNRNKEVETLMADYTVLATGGAGQLFLHSTNHAGMVGSALSMASRAFVRLEHIEYTQFHPTAFYHQLAPRFLITEALRGEGAILLNAKGKRFMPKYHPDAELAPRDIVSQSIVNELLTSNQACVFLDARKLADKLDTRFPTVFNNCLKYDIDIRTDLIPVVPAAHYMCGGVLTDERGRTTLERLYSVGECSCTGLHGANRLASTSLLEALLWGYAAAKDISKRLKNRNQLKKNLRAAIADWAPSGFEQNDDPALIAQDWTSIKNTMWNYTGIVRSEARLKRAFAELRDLSNHLHEFYKSTPLSKPLLELFHGCQAAYTITQAALRNKKSLGCHRRID